MDKLIDEEKSNALKLELLESESKRKILETQVKCMKELVEISVPIGRWKIGELIKVTRFKSEKLEKENDS